MEADFFSGQDLPPAAWPQASDTLLVTDFDETMTEQDSTAAIIAAAIAGAAAAKGVNFWWVLFWGVCEEERGCCPGWASWGQVADVAVLVVVSRKMESDRARELVVGHTCGLCGASCVQPGWRPLMPVSAPAA